MRKYHSDYLVHAPWQAQILIIARMQFYKLLQLFQQVAQLFAGKRLILLKLLADFLETVSVVERVSFQCLLEPDLILFWHLFEFRRFCAILKLHWPLKESIPVNHFLSILLYLQK